MRRCHLDGRALPHLPVLALIALLLVACERAPASATGASVALGPSPSPAELRLYVFDCGRIRLPTVTDFGLADTDTDVRVLAVPCYLVEHPAGRLLWDAGLPVQFAGGDWIDDETGAGHLLERTLVEQLEDLALTPADIDLIAFSHFHYDHVGQANDFVGARLLIRKAERDAAFGDEPGAAFFVPELYAELADTPTDLVDGIHDVFGDGRVLLLPAAGHTPGHQVLFLDLPETGPLVLSGDLYHFAESRALGAVPLFNTDPAATRASMARIEDFVAERSATFWIQHELARFETLRLAPAFYD
ncbi:MAG: N-acyl homoserine lactonase family protein [Pseudomonadales bacterium]|nr:N-acyl homoserine lactonase family protein [Pseudomonadales bacterium]